MNVLFKLLNFPRTETKTEPVAERPSCINRIGLKYIGVNTTTGKVILLCEKE